MWKEARVPGIQTQNCEEAVLTTTRMCWRFDSWFWVFFFHLLVMLTWADLFKMNQRWHGRTWSQSAGMRNMTRSASEMFSFIVLIPNRPIRRMRQSSYCRELHSAFVPTWWLFFTPCPTNNIHTQNSSQLYLPTRIFWRPPSSQYFDDSIAIGSISLCKRVHGPAQLLLGNPPWETFITRNPRGAFHPAATLPPKKRFALLRRRS